MASPELFSIQLFPQVKIGSFFVKVGAAEWPRHRDLGIASFCLAPLFFAEETIFSKSNAAEVLDFGSGWQNSEPVTSELPHAWSMAHGWNSFKMPFSMHA